MLPSLTGRLIPYLTQDSGMSLLWFGQAGAFAMILFLLCRDVRYRDTITQFLRVKSFPHPAQAMFFSFACH